MATKIKDGSVVRNKVLGRVSNLSDVTFIGCSFSTKINPKLKTEMRKQRIAEQFCREDSDV